MQLSFSESLSCVLLHFRTSPEDARCYHSTVRVLDRTHVQTRTSGGILVEIHHASLRVLIPARRKEANEDIPGGQRPPQRHLYSEQGLTAYPKLVEIGAPLPIQGHIRPLHSVHFPAFLPLEDFRSCDVFVKTLRIK